MSIVLYFKQILMHNTGLSDWEPLIYVWFIFHWLAMSHCCYNPVIYCYMNARFRIGFLQILYFIPGIRRCCCINTYTRDRSTSLRTGIALTGKLHLLIIIVVGGVVIVHWLVLVEIFRIILNNQLNLHPSLFFFHLKTE